MHNNFVFGLELKKKQKFTKYLLNLVVKVEAFITGVINAYPIQYNSSRTLVIDMIA